MKSGDALAWVGHSHHLMDVIQMNFYWMIVDEPEVDAPADKDGTLVYFL